MIDTCEAKGRLALVTGATRLQGIGFAVCRALAEAGTDIAFTHFAPYDRAMAWGVEADEQARIERELAAFGVRCAGFAADLSARDAAPRLLDAVAERFGRTPDALVNNAAYSTDSSYRTLDAVDAMTATLAAELREELGTRFPLGRVGLPQDAARLVAFLCSEEAAWVTGQVLHSHGGFRK